MEKSANTKNYKTVKNYINNELGFNGEFIRDIIEKSVEKQIYNYVNNTFSSSHIDFFIKEAINKKVNDALSSYDFSNKIKKLIYDKIKLDLNDE